MNTYSTAAIIIVALFITGAMVVKELLFPQLTGAASIGVAAGMGGVAGGIGSVVGKALFPRKET